MATQETSHTEQYSFEGPVNLQCIQAILGATGLEAATAARPPEKVKRGRKHLLVRTDQ